MALLVVKFGGTSVGDIQKIQKAAKIVATLVTQGNKVIAVVSAMAGETNKLVGMCNDISDLSDYSSRAEYDVALSTGETLSASLLALSLQHIGINAKSLQGWQAGICSNNVPSNSLITHVDASIIRKLIDEDIVPVITGFQALNDDGRITTIGRGGSDTSAAAIASAIGADFCDIYTDVEGVFTSDPRLVHNAQLIPKISFEEMLELAGMGAKVLHPRSVEICMRYNISMRVFSTFTNNTGTIIMPNVDELNKITAVSYLRKLNIIYIDNINHFSVRNDIIDRLARSQIHIHQILESSGDKFTFAIQQDQLSRALDTLKDFSLNHNDGIAQVGIVGAAIRHDCSLLSNLLKTLSEIDVIPHFIVNSEIKLSLYINEETLEKTVKTLHEQFIEKK